MSDERIKSKKLVTGSPMRIGVISTAAKEKKTSSGRSVYRADPPRSFIGNYVYLVSGEKLGHRIIVGMPEEESLLTVERWADNV